ncbi:Sua5/YciO/YrdC/YwlC family protein [Actinomadura sp. ATCC 31491]|uniref:Sua5/YciO/YrdC/YwlC family protein n=1 Tax=Actinomadura luzonensis TaxID=2805427 RepID=A0ABT0FYA2_9ACTN|nr:Sua5/YciO/YrdC/YwlC family protein [Actinomadura luzonensis]MCK2217324.1 Sua5/YciO/YrdC/YwlC family protein [Actinomadura luzonensis]
METAPPTGLPPGPGARVPAAAAVLAPAAAAVPPDLATCAACLLELFDPGARRHRYAFTGCAACGPRASIAAGPPFARERTALRRFPMCAACAAEYRDPAGRRFRDEAVACPACGPRLSFLGLSGDAALRAAGALVAAGGVIAVKGPGGTRLVCDAANADSVARLRHAGGEPALMVPGPAAAAAFGRLTAQDRRLLASPGAPVLLVPRREGAPAGPPELGLVLPHTPVHHLLLDAVRRPLAVSWAGLPAGPGRRFDDVDGVLGDDLPAVSACGAADGSASGSASGAAFGAADGDTVLRSLGARAGGVRAVAVRRGAG